MQQIMRQAAGAADAERIPSRACQRVLKAAGWQCDMRQEQLECLAAGLGAECKGIVFLTLIKIKAKVNKVKRSAGDRKSVV